MNAQEQRFYEFGLHHARTLKNRKELALAKRIAADYAERIRQLADSLDAEKVSERYSDCRSIACEGSDIGKGSDPFHSLANPKKRGELLSLIEKLEKEERELLGSLNIREDSILDEYEKMLRGESTQ